MRTSWRCLAIAVNLFPCCATAQWLEANGQSEFPVKALAVSGTSVFAGTDGNGVFLSTDNGTRWTSLKAGMSNQEVTSLAVMGTNVFAGTKDGVFRTTDNDSKWVAASTGLTCREVLSLVVSGTDLFAGTFNNGGTYRGGIFLSTNSGESWTAVNTGLPSYTAGNGGSPAFPTVTSLASSPEGALNACLLAGTDHGVFLSTDNGAKWTAVNAGLADTSISAVAICGTNLFAGTLGKGLFRSSNRGAFWGRHILGSGGAVYSLASQGTDLLVGRAEGMDILHADGSVGGIDFGGPPVYALAWTGMNIYVGFRDGVYRSTDNGSNWAAPPRSGLPNNVSSLASGSTNLFAGSYDSGVYLSADRGKHWTAANAGLPAEVHISKLIVSGTNILAGTLSAGLFRSDNCGKLWNKVEAGFPASASVTSFAFDPRGAGGTTLFAGTDGSGIFRSTDNGVSWSVLDPGLNSSVNSLVFQGSDLFAGTSNGVFRSTDSGSHWTSATSNLPGCSVIALASCSGTLLAAPDYGRIFLSTNRGTSWTDSIIGLPWVRVRALTVSSTNVFAGTDGIGCYLSTDGGTNWTNVSAGLPDPAIIHAFAIHSGNLFAASAYGGVCRRPLAELIALADPNLVTNPGFEFGTEPWKFYANSSGIFSDNAAGAESVHAARVDVTSPGTNMQLYQSDIPLKAHMRYRLSFKAYSNTEHRLSVFLHKHTAPYTSYALDGWECRLTQPWKTFMKEFTSENITDSVTDARLRFWFAPFAKAGDQYFIDDVELVETEPHLISNGDFEWGTNGWEFYTDGADCFETGAEVDASNHAAQVKIQSPGANVQLYQSGVSLDAGAKYRLSFRAYSSSGHALGVYLHKHGAPYSSYGLAWDSIPLGTSWQTFTKEFVATGFKGTAKDGRLRFWLSPFAAAGDEYFFDDVTLTRVDGQCGPAVMASVQANEPERPTEFSLSQNYPNPFNPSTTIRYALPKQSRVTLTVFNTLGEQVAELVNAELGQGYHEVTLDGSKLASGVYFYRLAAGGFVGTKRLLLLK